MTACCRHERWPTAAASHGLTPKQRSSVGKNLCPAPQTQLCIFAITDGHGTRSELRTAKANADRISQLAARLVHHGPALKRCRV